MVDAKDYHEQTRHRDHGVFILFDSDIKNSTRRLMVYIQHHEQKVYCVCYQSPEKKEQNIVNQVAMSDIKEAQVLAKDFILAKFDYQDDYYAHIRGHDYERKVKNQSSYWTAMNENGQIQRLKFTIPSNFSIVHSSKHQKSTLIILKS